MNQCWILFEDGVSLFPLLHHLGLGGFHPNFSQKIQRFISVVKVALMDETAAHEAREMEMISPSLGMFVPNMP